LDGSLLDRLRILDAWMVDALKHLQEDLFDHLKFAEGEVAITQFPLAHPLVDQAIHQRL
jgi:hypothetical protein